MKLLNFIAGFLEGAANWIRPKPQPTLQEIADALKDIPFNTFDDNTINFHAPDSTQHYKVVDLDPFTLACRRRQAELIVEAYEPNSCESRTEEIKAGGEFAGWMGYARIGTEWSFCQVEAQDGCITREDAEVWRDWLAEVDAKIDFFMDEQDRRAA